jgi:hypothetical protein
VVFEGHQEGKTPVNENRLRVIDADGHVVEPVEMWEDYLELGYRHRRPKLVEAGDGQHGEGQDPRRERDATVQVGVRVPG